MGSGGGGSGRGGVWDVRLKEGGEGYQNRASASRVEGVQVLVILRERNNWMPSKFGKEKRELLSKKETSINICGWAVALWNDDDNQQLPL